MKKTLYRKIMFLISIVNFALLVAITVKVGVFSEMNFNAVFKIIKVILKNPYITNVLCSILAVLIIYCAQVQYSKRMLKKDFRCNEIMEYISRGIQSYCDIAEEIPQKQERKVDEYLFEKQKTDALMYYEFYKKNQSTINLVDLDLSYMNNDILIESVQACFLINLNFKLLNIINNIKTD